MSTLSKCLTRRANSTTAAVFLAATLGSMLAGCGQGNQPAAPKGQVIAQVGKDDITQQELENEFRWLGVPADKRDDAVIKRVLGDLVQRKYLAQKATETKLDREPTVLLDMIRSREQVLANSYMQRDLSGRSTSIGKNDLDKYILSRPAMFAGRQTLTIDRVTIPLTPAAQAAVEASKNAKSLEEVEQKLKEVGMLYNRSMGVISTGDFPEDFVKTLRAQKPEDVFFTAVGTTGMFFKVRRQENSPLSGEDASKVARQLVLRDLAQAEAIKQAATAQANAKYQGEYARIMNAAPDSKGK
jgi:EpsD family peptidyl-prolyl cis-trans isomerase